MPIDPERARQAEPLTYESSWSPQDVRTYNVGLGLGGSSDGSDVMGYLADEPTVLPSFAVIPVTPLIARLNDIPGIDVCFGNVLHGEHTLEMFRPMESTGSVRSTMAVSRVTDKGSAALIDVTIDSVDQGDDSLIARHEVSYFVRGEGGVGDASRKTTTFSAPSREADHVVTHRTDTNQALVFSLSGDRNPVHVDPEAAQAAGLRGPILHGLCTYGIVCKAVVDEVLGGDPGMVLTYSARFTGLVYPGQTVTTSIWEEPDGLVLEATTDADTAPVLRGRMTTTKHGS